MGVVVTLMARAVTFNSVLEMKLVAIVLVLCVSVVNAFDSDLWTQVLQRNVHPGVLQGIKDNVVDYAALAVDPDFPKVLKSMADTPPGKLTKNETYALYMNGMGVSHMARSLGVWLGRGTVVSPCVACCGLRCCVEFAAAYNMFAMDMYIRHPCYLNGTKCVPQYNIWRTSAGCGTVPHSRVHSCVLRLYQTPTDVTRCVVLVRHWQQQCECLGHASGRYSRQGMDTW